MSYIPGTTRLQPSSVPAEEPAWATDPVLSREYDMGGGAIQRLYTVGALAAALGKSPVTVRRWIAKRIIPDASMRTGNISSALHESGRRLYTREQIEVIVAIAHREGVLRPDRTKVQRWSSNAFSARVWAYWRQHDW